MALKAVAGGAAGGGLIGSTGCWSIQLSNAAGAVVNGVVYVAQGLPFDATLTEMYYITDSGSFDVVVSIAGVSVTGFSITVNTAGLVAATATNVAIAGDDILVTITNSTGNPVNAALQLSYTRDSL